MKQCIALAKEAMQQGNPPVGSIVVKNNMVIGIGREAGKSSKNITRHAEIEAINDVISKQYSLDNSILYTTHEPCIMCSYVIRHHQIKTIVYGVPSNYVGGATSEFKILETQSVPQWNVIPKLISGVLEDQCKALSHAYQLKQQ